MLLLVPALCSHKAQIWVVSIPKILPFKAFGDGFKLTEDIFELVCDKRLYFFLNLINFDGRMYSLLLFLLSTIQCSNQTVLQEYLYLLVAEGLQVDKQPLHVNGSQFLVVFLCLHNELAN